MALWSVGIFVDLIWPLPSVLFLKLNPDIIRGQTIIAYAIEHIAERFGLFIIVVMGEIVGSVLSLYDYDFEIYEASSELYLLTVFGITVAACCQWLYFDIECGQNRIYLFYLFNLLQQVHKHHMLFIDIGSLVYCGFFCICHCQRV